MPASSPRYHLAQYNAGRLVAPLDDPRIDDFRNNLDLINHLAERSPGYVWRHQDASGNATGTRVSDDPLFIVNLTVWESIEALFAYAYKSEHVEFFRRRREFFEDHAGEHYLALWWIPAGHIPSIEEAEERLAHLKQHGPSEHVFTFKQRFAAPATPGVAAP